MILKLLATVVLCLGLLPERAQAQALWSVRKSEWSADDTQKWEDFVGIIGDLVVQRKCQSLRSCLARPENPYRAGEPASIIPDVDCADLPYVLRAYFAWKNNLPFSYQSEMSGGQYAPDGNRVVQRESVANGSAIAPLLRKLAEDIHSGFYRYSPTLNNTDFYSVKLSTAGIRPGTTIYDPQGHVALVHKVSVDGLIFYIDAHPGNSLTSDVYGNNFIRSRTTHGAGFKNWRPQKLMGADCDSAGICRGGRIELSPNNSLENFSTEQYDGTDGHGHFAFHGRNLNYYDYVRAACSQGDVRYDPVAEVELWMHSLCSNFTDRMASVQSARDAGVLPKSHPAHLPNNIYGADDAEWEMYSTPSRDARIKTRYRDLREKVQLFVEKYRAGDSSIAYAGHDIKADMLRAYDNASEECQLSYLSSQNLKINFNLEQARQRLFAMSFDPYHCVEFRWGASGDELAGCRDDANKKAWYRNEQGLRNQLERSYNQRMNYDLNEVQRAGVAQAPDIDVRGYLLQQMLQPD